LGSGFPVAQPPAQAFYGQEEYMATDSKTRPQFSLAALLGSLLACGLIFGFIANIESSYRVSIRCNTLPADDTKLAEWYGDRVGVQDVSTTRIGNTTFVEFTNRRGSIELFTPPLAEFGYKGLQKMESTTTKSSIIGGAFNWFSKLPMFVWFGVAAVLCAFLVRKVVSGSISR
jgi:hypothetical protein